MLDSWSYAALTGVAALAGFIDSIAGGGGLIMIPALLFAGVPPLHALGTNKLQSVFGTGVALRNYWRSGLIEWRPNRLTVAAGLCRAVGGALVVQQSTPTSSTSSFPLLLVAAALYVLLSPRMTDEDAHHRVTSAGYAPVGAAIGFYDGFFGPGAGTFYTTSLVALRGYGLTKATALTKLFNIDQRPRQPRPVRDRRAFAVAARAVHGGRRDGRRLARLAFRAALRRAADPAVAGAISLSLTTRLLWAYFAG